MNSLIILQAVLLAIVIFGPLVAVYLYLELRRNAQSNPVATKKEYALLRLMAPKINDKSPQAAQELFAALHGIFQSDASQQDEISFEIASRDQFIQFFVWVPLDQLNYIQGQIYAQYPSVEISRVSDYTDIDLSEWAIAGTELSLAQTYYYPIKTFNNFTVDPLAAITGVLSQVEAGEQIWFQIIVRPVANDWQAAALKYIKMTQKGEKPKPPPPPMMAQIVNGTAKYSLELLQTAVLGQLPAAAKPEEKKAPDLGGPQQEALKLAEAKTTKLGFETVIRIAAIAQSEDEAKAKIRAVLGALNQYSLSNSNSFVAGPITTDKASIQKLFSERELTTRGLIMNTEELASIYHLPATTVETPNIVWAGAKKGEPPSNLPAEGMVDTNNVTLFGLSNYRHLRYRFGIKLPDRRYHMYAIGKTGTGKSTLLRNMIIDDIQKGRGVCVVDPHGDLISHVLDYIPADRIDDVVYFNPADTEYPIGFNLLESVDPSYRNIVASGLMSIFTKLWANVWSARMEYILRNVILALLEYDGATMLEAMRLLVDPGFRRKVLAKVKDPVVSDFFMNEYEKYDPKYRTESIAAIQNKIGQFLSSSIIRNIMGQEKSSFDMREIMDSGKIFLVDLSVGKIGEDNAALLGSMVITKIQLAAMSRANIPEDERRDFYLYVDEFQNFATDSFAVILSEARKYHLNLIITHQYIAQMSETVAAAVFGNVGTIISFRVGSTDAGVLEREFSPVFNADDLVRLDNYQIYLKMAIDARTAVPFSAQTLPPEAELAGNRQAVIEASRAKYSADRESVAEQISQRTASATTRSGVFTEVDGEYQYKVEHKPYEPLTPLPATIEVGDKQLFKIRSKEGTPFYVHPEDFAEQQAIKASGSTAPVTNDPPQTTKPQPVSTNNVRHEKVIQSPAVDRAKITKPAPEPIQPSSQIAAEQGTEPPLTGVGEPKTGQSEPEESAILPMTNLDA